MVFLALQKDPAVSLRRRGQLATRHPTPAATALVWCLEPPDLEIPEGIEIHQAVATQNIRPTLIQEIYHWCEFGPPKYFSREERYFLVRR